MPGDIPCPTSLHFCFHVAFEGCGSEHNIGHAERFWNCTPPKNVFLCVRKNFRNGCFQTKPWKSLPQQRSQFIAFIPLLFFPTSHSALPPLSANSLPSAEGLVTGRMGFWCNALRIVLLTVTIKLLVAHVVLSFQTNSERRDVVVC